jgi:hypothetical protein
MEVVSANAFEFDFTSSAAEPIFIKFGILKIYVENCVENFSSCLSCISLRLHLSSDQA